MGTLADEVITLLESIEPLCDLTGALSNLQYKPHIQGGVAQSIAGNAIPAASCHVL